jgi:hypothetical protein
MGPFRVILVVGGDAQGDAVARAVGANYDMLDASTTLNGEQGSLWNGRDPVDEGSAKDRDVLLRLAKAGFSGREFTLDELSATRAPATPPAGTE